MNRGVSLKRTLSESSSGSSEDATEDDLRFKKPTKLGADSFTDAKKRQTLERRERAPSTSVSVSEDEELDGQVPGLDLNSLEAAADMSTPPSKVRICSAPAFQSHATGSYSAVSLKLMSKMGYRSGQGLGKTGQGRVEPVVASKQKGRRGLGLVLKGLEEESVQWDSDQEHIAIKEEVTWMPSYQMACPSFEVLRTWTREGPRKTSIDDELTFCDKHILRKVLSGKSVFDQLEPEELRKARTRSNPFETIKGVFFLNRAAMKMANLDAVFDFMFTKPNGLNKDKDLLYFADVCAGPGGFSEYVLWRKKWRSKGFGFTLKGSHDFKLEDFLAGPPESFEPHYGVNGRDGDGDVFKAENIDAFRDFVRESTGGLGVHFMMADGGFSVDGQENIQEILSKQLYLCQCLMALMIVRTAGHFVCKLFDLFTPFSVGLVYLMYLSFEQVCIHKPNTSRPANSERYLVCKAKRANCEDIAQYLYNVNLRLTQLGFNNLGHTSSPVDVIEIVPMSILMADEAFVDYITQSNNCLGQWQIVGLAKIVAFCKDTSLREIRQSEIRQACLKYWQIPDELRKAPPPSMVKEQLNTLLKCDLAFMNTSSTILTPFDVETCIGQSPFDWECVLLGCPENKSARLRGFYFGSGRSRNFFLTHSGVWERPANELTFDLPAKTLIYAEVVEEMRGEARNMRRTLSLSIIDAVFLGGEDLRHLDWKSRLDVARLFAKSINKPSIPQNVVIRVKDIFGLENLQHQLKQLTPRVLKNSGMRLRPTASITDTSDRYFMPSGVLMFRIVNDPFTIAWSKTAQKKYWFNIRTRESGFEFKAVAIHCQTAFAKRLIWNWDDRVQLIPQVKVDADADMLQADTLVEIIEKLCPESWSQRSNVQS